MESFGFLFYLTAPFLVTTLLSKRKMLQIHKAIQRISDMYLFCGSTQWWMETLIQTELNKTLGNELLDLQGRKKLQKMEWKIGLRSVALGEQT